MHANDLPVVGQALPPANRIISHLLTVAAPNGAAGFRNREKMRPQAGAGKLKHAPPMQGNAHRIPSPILKCEY
jgi:hypothetical protein